MRWSRIVIALVGVAAACLLGPASVLAGYHLIGPDEYTTFYVSGGRLLRSRQGTIAIDLRTGRLRVSAFEQRGYWEGTVTAYCRARYGNWLAKAEAYRAALRKRPGSAETRQDFERADEEVERARRWTYGETDPRVTPLRITIEPTETTEEIAGRPARKYRVLANGRLSHEVWLSTDPAFNREFAPDTAPDT